MAVRVAWGAFDRPFPLIFLGMALGLLVGRPSPWIGPVAIVLLAALMSLALAPFEIESFPRRSAGPAIALLASAGILSPAFLVVGLWYPAETWPGWVLLAAVPPAISVIPYAGLLRGDLDLALGGTLLGYAAAFVQLPLVSWIFLGSSVDLLPLLQATAFLILVPLVLSRAVGKVRASEISMSRVRNVLFFAVYALVTAAIRDVVFADPLGVAAVLGGTGAAIALAWSAWTAIQTRLHVRMEARITLSLFASYKNQTLAAALALSLIGPVAALPAILAGVFEALWLVVIARVAAGSRRRARAA